MAENASEVLTEEQLAERQEQFRYTDMTHPLIECLFEIAPADTTTH